MQTQSGFVCERCCTAPLLRCAPFVQKLRFAASLGDHKKPAAHLWLQVDLENWNQDERFGAYGGAHAMVLGGYSQLTDAMASHVRALHYESAVASLTVADGGVTAMTHDGRDFRGDLAIVAVPVGVLKAGGLQFSPELPAWKQQALGQIGMGKLNKVCLSHQRGVLAIAQCVARVCQGKKRSSLFICIEGAACLSSFADRTSAEVLARA